MPALQTEIILRHAGTELARVTLPPGKYIVGRGEEAHIRADTPLLSRRHALLTIQPDALLLEDLGSSNGTFVDEQPIAGVATVAPSQTARLGDVRLEIWREGDSGPTFLESAAPASAPALPTELSDAPRYAIGAQIARGGMGAILDAEQSAMERRVAMKVMLEGAQADDVRRFVDEAKITGQLEHPNIVPVHELGVDAQGRPFYTMKFVRGITLKKVLELLAEGVEVTVKKYPLPALLTIFQKACDAVAFAHAKGVIHRDLKPENIMLGDFGEVLVMDWGLAKVIGSAEAVGATNRLGAAAGSTMAGTVMGTPHYMAPEQARGEVETMDQRADIYALGAILFHILALRPSVSGDDPWTIVTKVARGEVETLRSGDILVAVEPTRAGGAQTAGKAAGSARAILGRRQECRRSIPASLAAVVRKAMAFDKSQRYASVPDLQADLTAYQNGFATSAEKAGLARQLILALKRHKVAAAGIAAVLAVGSVFGTKALLEGQRAERALAELKKSAPAFAAEADSLLLKGDVEGALARLATAIQLDGENPRWFARQGQILDAALRFPEAAAAYASAAALDAAGPWKEARAASEKLAASRQPDGQYPMPMLRELAAQARSDGRTGDELLLLTPLQTAAKDALPLWQAKLQAWLGKDAPKLKVQTDGGLALSLTRLGVSDLSPLRGMPLGSIELGYTNVSDLSPLKGMPLVGLNIERTKVSDLSPLTGMRLKWLAMADAPVSDLTPLRGMPLLSFTAQTRTLTDISPLRDSPLTSYLRIEGSRVTDLSPLAGKKIQYLNLPDNPLENLDVIRGMPLKQFHLRASGYGPELIDLVLSLPQLEILSLNPSTPGFERLRTHPTLKLIGHDGNKPDLQRPVAEYWRAYDERKAEAQKNALLNLDVRMREDGTKRLQLKEPSLTAIPPLDWTNVSVFIFFDTKISDLSPLRGVKLKSISFLEPLSPTSNPCAAAPW